MTVPVNRRVVIHFPGFERMSPAAHHARFIRTVRRTAQTWGFSTKAGPLGPSGASSDFEIVATGAAWRTVSRVTICDHDAIVAALAARPLWRRLMTGYRSAARVVADGGFAGYVRTAWRFSLFFLFPFLLMGVMLAACLSLATLPFWQDLGLWHLLWSVPLAFAGFRFVLLPAAERFHTLHLFSDWDLAVAAGRLDDPHLARWLEASAGVLQAALGQEADEVVVSSHSMGSTLAAHVLGMVLERDPAIVTGKRIVFVTLGGAIPQCALLRSATLLRARVGRIARTPEITFLEVQCLTDVIHFYKSRVVALCGHPEAPQAQVVAIRVRHVLTPARYARIRRDFLRVHRQYVLDADLRSAYDFTVQTIGPFPAGLVSDFSKRDFEMLTDPAEA